MNLTALKTWVSGETLTATDLNGEFQNIYTHTITNSDIDSTGTYVLGELVVGSGITAADGGQFHVHTASAGSVQAHADANEAVLENSAASGLSILSGSSSDGNIFFGDAADNDIGKIAYSHSANSLAFTTNGATALTLSSAQAATFAGDVSVGGALTLTGGLTLNGAVVVGDSASDTLTVNATVTSDLLFTDATHDIGKSGATRPRDGFFSRNVAIGGTLGVTGLITATGGVSGALTGNVTGNLTGNVTGNVTGNLTGDVTGNISGNVTGGTISGSTGLYTSTLATSAGDIGVGTHSPSGFGARTLNIKAASSSGADLTIEADNGNNFGVFFSGATTNDPFSIFSNTGFKFAIASDKNATGFDEALRIKSDGNVGFNETSPDTIIHATQGGEPPAEGMLILEANSSSRQLRIQPPTNADNGFFDARGGNMTFLDDGTEIWRYNASTFITSSGINVGIGTSSPTAPLEVYASATTAQNTAIVIDGPAGNNYEGVQYRVGGVGVGYTAQESTGRMYHGAGIEHRFRTGSGSTVGGTDALTIDNSQRVGIGTVSPAAPVDINTSGNTHLIFKYQDSSTQRSFIATNAGVSTNYNGLVIGSNATQQGTQANTGLSSWYQRLGPIDATGDAWSVAYQAAGGSVVERARITSAGDLLVNTSSAIASASNTANNFTFSPSSGYAWLAVSDSGGVYTQRQNDGNFFTFYKTTSNVGSISVSGSTTAYNTTSDYRLKENVINITDGITRIKSLKPSRFNFISNADQTVDGFVAHEVSDVVPEAISGAKDAVDDEGNPEYQGIDQSKLVPLLTAALQEAITKIETLETKVAALEAA